MHPISRIFLYCCWSALLFSLVVTDLSAQGRRSRAEDDIWPPVKTYSRISLGHALQRVFQKHYDFCGFPPAAGRRDYTPPTIGNFLGRRTLRTKVEMADISGANMLAYIFSAEELEEPLDDLNFASTRVIELAVNPDEMMPRPKPGFDAFVLTRNCSGYLKACLDAGIEPPYAAFSAALNTDDRRESSVLTVAGSFESPLLALLNERSDRTTQLMSILWQFYQSNPEFNGQAYYLREFEGVMVRHLTDAESIFQAERKLGVNVNLPLTARLKADVQRGTSNQLSFGGTDWETIVYADYDRDFDRKQLFSPLPSAQAVADYFSTLNLSYSTTEDNSVLTEGIAHQHQIRLSGLTPELARARWEIQNLQPGVYRELPRVTNEYFDEGNGRFGAVFTISGTPDPALFRNRKRDRKSVVEINYQLVNQDDYNAPIYLTTRQEVATSLHPSLNLISNSFDLSKRDNRQYAFEWEIELQLEDDDNPVDFEQRVLFSIQSARSSGGELALNPISAVFDARRHSLIVTVATAESWPLRRINDQKMQDYNLVGELQLPLARGKTVAARPLQAVIAVPTILPEAPTETLAPSPEE